jgi:hypothetical protein
MTTASNRDWSIDPLMFHTRERNERLLSGMKGRCLCGEDRAAAMTKSGKCYACGLRERGKPIMEGHHLFGRSVPIVIMTPGNEHRVFDALREARYAPLKEPSSNTLVNDAALLMQFVEIAEMFNAAAERGQLPQWVEDLSDVLIDRGREAVEALLVLAGHLQDRLGDDWDPHPWTP